MKAKPKSKMTFDELLNFLYDRGDNLADVALGRMMDSVEEETGHWPSWTDEVPEWILEICGLN